MEIQLSLGVILNGAVIVLGLFAAVNLFFRTSNSLPNKIMAIFLACISLWLIDTFLRISGIYGKNPDLYFLPIYYSLAFGPLIYFYVKSIINSGFRFRKIHALHFLPVLIQTGLYIFLSSSAYTFKRWYWIEVHFPYTYRIEFDGSFISLAIYLFFSILLLVRYQKWLNETYSETTDSRLNWLKIILILMLVITLQWFVEVILRDFYAEYYNYNYSVFLLGILTLILAYRAFHQADQQEIVFENKISSDQATKKADFAADVPSLIEKRMSHHQDYLNPTLSLKAFASNCKLPQKVVSQYLNQELDKSFHTYVNEYRVEAFKRLSREKESEGMTLEGLAYDCGFNSKASFNRIFKKFTGKTPSQYTRK